MRSRTSIGAEGDDEDVWSNKSVLTNECYHTSAASILKRDKYLEEDYKNKDEINIYKIKKQTGRRLDNTHTDYGIEMTVNKLSNWKNNKWDNTNTKKVELSLKTQDLSQK